VNIVTACCPRETIPDSCSCPDGCGCHCMDCICVDSSTAGTLTKVFSLTRRPMPGRLRYLAEQLRSGTDPKLVALALDATAADVATGNCERAGKDAPLTPEKSRLGSRAEGMTERD
jgi:hypothetical protein